MVLMCINVYGWEDSDWNTYTYEESICWTYNKPDNSTNGWLVTTPEPEFKRCYNITLGNQTFEIQSLVAEIPLDKLSNWKKVDWNTFDTIEITMYPCKV